MCPKPQQTQPASSSPLKGEDCPNNSKAGASLLLGHPLCLESFYKAYPSFIWGPLLFSSVLYAATAHIPSIRNYREVHQMEYYGFHNALQYTVFAILSSYAFHGWCATHAPHSLKLQSDKAYEVSPSAMAVRSTAALLTQMVYTFLPLSPATTTWVQFSLWTAVFAVYWDAHFYVAHRWAHENKAAYRFFHKTHHMNKEPNCFGAYFITYQSHILLEQIVVVLVASIGLPVDVFNFYMYWGTIGTYIEHSGFEVGLMKLPFIPVTFGQLCKIISFPTSWLLDGEFLSSTLIISSILTFIMLGLSFVSLCSKIKQSLLTWSLSPTVLQLSFFPKRCKCG